MLKVLNHVRHLIVLFIFMSVPYILSSQSNVYRFYDASKGKHFWTTNANGELFSGKSEGVAFKSFSEKWFQNIPHVVGVTRFYNPNLKKHFWTINEEESRSLNGYVNEGIVFYASTENCDDCHPIFRFYDSNTNEHFWTQDENGESFGGELEGVAWFSARKKKKSKKKNKSVLGQVVELGENIWKEAGKIKIGTGLSDEDLTTNGFRNRIDYRFLTEAGGKKYLTNFSTGNLRVEIEKYYQLSIGKSWNRLSSKKYLIAQGEKKFIGYTSDKNAGASGNRLYRYVVINSFLD